MIPPADFVTKLYRYDPLLRLRWGVRTELWIIERKMESRQPQYLKEKPSPWKSKRGLDLYDGWKEGYLHVLSVHPSLLDNRVFEHLRESDIWAEGGMRKMMRKIEEWREQTAAEEARDQQNWNEGASREAFDRLQWLYGNRMAVNDPEPPMTDTGLGFKVRDRRHGASQDTERSEERSPGPPG